MVAARLQGREVKGSRYGFGLEDGVFVGDEGVVDGELGVDAVGGGGGEGRVAEGLVVVGGGGVGRVALLLDGLVGVLDDAQVALLVHQRLPPLEPLLEVTHLRP